MPRRRRLAALVGVAALVAAPAEADTIRVTVNKLAFSPSQITARVGDTVEWTNDDFLAHTATARDKAWDIVLAPKQSSRVVLKRPGEIAYFCRFHPNMGGRITVAPK